MYVDSWTLPCPCSCHRAIRHRRFDCILYLATRLLHHWYHRSPLIIGGLALGVVALCVSLPQLVGKGTGVSLHAGLVTEPPTRRRNMDNGSRTNQPTEAGIAAVSQPSSNSRGRKKKTKSCNQYLVLPKRVLAAVLPRRLLLPQYQLVVPLSPASRKRGIGTKKQPMILT